MDLHTALVLLHVIGTILGVGGATIAEVQINKALKDGVVDASEKALMHANYFVIRVGTVIVVLSGIALVWWWLTAGGSDWVLTTHKVWVKEIITIIIVLNAVALARRWVPLWLGSAISFTSWWTATVLGVWRDVPYSFWTLFISYLLAIGVVAVVLHYIRIFFKNRAA
ncbi:MAG: hypothetical protein CMI56_02190 [Parcubacteria group bacterium]|nr:hypothetical protein [Parcubacteria group bacterium]|tara:strand:- start:4223 stop:4726 length:504 start_codon:yes stop_codon:yes gene_type:complete